ncbi:MAG: LytTR family two component transcriptional regulator [Sphingomonas bacterium]|jgi:two-component system LytT family response regulator|nr:LytTR family two component transcriptional regulator [Sphingomonas bacterium]MDB5717093.1 LytTR family two component transcriptional regulator [Sphingomonas bacterium]
MRVLLVDDEALALDRLAALFADIDGAEVVGQATSGDQALALIAALTPDLVILDIQMPGRNGLRTAAEIDLDPRPEIVFVTADEHHAPDAFDLDAADYLLKPVRFDRLRHAVERARRRKALRERAGRVELLEEQVLSLRSTAAEARDEASFWIPERHGQRRVPLDSINWIEAARDYVLLHTDMRSHMLRITMSALEEKLAGSALLRVHRSAFVRPDRVIEVRREHRSTALILADGSQVPVGPSYLAAIEAILHLH